MSKSVFANQKVVPLAKSLWEKACNARESGRFDTTERLFRSAAGMGDPYSMDALASLIDNSIKPSRPEEAVLWYKRALAAGHNESAWNLAMHYVPLGQKRWYRFWMRKAADLGVEDAKIEMQKIDLDPDYMTVLPWIDPEL